MIDLDQYLLSTNELQTIEQLLSQSGTNPSLDQLYVLMDQVWRECGCSANNYDHKNYTAFYSHPIWLLNGMFIEQHYGSLAHRRNIANAISRLRSTKVIDFGGGFGTLARMIAQVDHPPLVDVWDPYPPAHGIKACKPFGNIRFIEHPEDGHYDALVCTDVLEHVHDPLALLASMTKKVGIGGHLIIYNCFYPLIQCHLPSTFHLRKTFDEFCQMLGLQVKGLTEDNHATIYIKISDQQSDWKKIRKRERESRLSHIMDQWRNENPYASSLMYKLALVKADPLYYPSKLIKFYKHGS